MDLMRRKFRKLFKQIKTLFLLRIRSAAWISNQKARWPSKPQVVGSNGERSMRCFESPTGSVFIMINAKADGVTAERYLAFFRNRYHDTIKPWIGAGRDIAAQEMIDRLLNNIGLFGFVEDVQYRVHCGPEFCKAAYVLEDALKTGNRVDIEAAQEQFEAYAAQTRLPLRPPT